MAKKKGKTGIKGGRPRAVDLFCGCGGLALGFKQAGFDVFGAGEGGQIGGSRIF